MSKQREALQLALEALEEISAHYPADWEFDICIEAIKFAREALAELESEPVGIVRTVGGYPDDSKHTVEWLVKHKDLHDGDKLYAAPAASKPLTDEEIDAEFDRECWVTVVFSDGARGIALDKVTARDFARSIERAHGIIK